MTIELIVAMGENRVIGRDNRMPWHLPNDLKHFKALTMGKPIVMGRKTFESIGKALPGRLNVVLTRDQAFQAQDVQVVHDVDSVLALQKDYDSVVIIGGAKVYEQFLPWAHKLHITQVFASPEGDTYFPEIDETHWQIVDEEKHSKDDKHNYDYMFLSLDRKSSQ